MAVDLEGRNVIGRARNDGRTKRGDLPDALRERYRLDRQRYVVDVYGAQAERDPVFRDQGFRLSTRRSDPNLVRDLMDVVRLRRWAEVYVLGEAGFRREAWLQARGAGLEVWGYQPTQRDLQALALRRAVRAPREALRPPEAPTSTTPRRTIQGRNLQGPAYRLWRSEEAIKLRVSDPEIQARLIKGARAEMVAKLSRSGRVRDLHRDRPELFSRDRVHGR
jgi:hypothetical protein